MSASPRSVSKSTEFKISITPPTRSFSKYDYKKLILKESEEKKCASIIICHKLQLVVNNYGKVLDDLIDAINRNASISYLTFELLRLLEYKGEMDSLISTAETMSWTLDQSYVFSAINNARKIRRDTSSLVIELEREISKKLTTKS